MRVETRWYVVYFGKWYLWIFKCIGPAYAIPWKCYGDRPDLNLCEWD